MFDLKIIGGTVVDGTGAERYQADIGIKDGKIADIVRRSADGPAMSGEAAETIDATGHVVAPASSTSTLTTTARSAGTACSSRPAAMA